MSTKLAYISYFFVGLGMTQGDYRVTFIVFTLGILSLLLLYYKVEENMILEEINEAFNRNYKTSVFCKKLVHNIATAIT